MSIPFSQKNSALSISILFFISLFFIALNYKGTGDEGDSIMHYLFSKYAFKHPHHFFHHWAKPVYVFITCIPAQFGFIGIQVFNILINAVSIFLTFRVAQKLHIKYAYLAALFLAIFPHQIIYSLSGLTEPLFAFALVLILYLWFYKKQFISILILSFLPFIRSEGLVVMLVFFLYLILKRERKLIFLLPIGHIVYAVLGYLIFSKPLLWVLNENPYAMGESSYGSGHWNAFILNMRFSIGAAMYYVMWAGMLLGAYYTITKFALKKKVNFSLEELFLIYGIYFSIFFFHSFAWYKGWFHSFGLIRVMVGVLPLIAIICSKVMNDIFIFFVKENKRQSIMVLVVGFILAVNFYFAKYAIAPNRDFNLRGDQACQQEASEYIWQFHKDAYELPLYYTAPYISVVMKDDYFNEETHPDFKRDFHNNSMKKPCYVIWDDWFSPVESNVSLEAIQTRSEFKMIKKFTKWDIAGGKERTTILFKIEE